MIPEENHEDPDAAHAVRENPEPLQVDFFEVRKLIPDSVPVSPEKDSGPRYIEYSGECDGIRLHEHEQFVAGPKVPVYSDLCLCRKCKKRDKIQIHQNGRDEVEQKEFLLFRQLIREEADVEIEENALQQREGVF